MRVRATVVVPCFDEAQRLDVEAVRWLADRPDTGVLLVDDGSTDDTLALLRSLADDRPGRVEVLPLGEHAGKGEAVRQGLLAASRSGAITVAYCDADFATPAPEVHRLLELLHGRPDLVAVIGSRGGVWGPRLGRSTIRTAGSHWFSVAASIALRTRFHDTQCGAKAFRVGPGFCDAIEQPFASTWGFDAELLGRLLVGLDGRTTDPVAIAEEPLRDWHHMAGSKLSPVATVRAFAGLAVLRRHLRTWRRTASPST